MILLIYLHQKFPSPEYLLLGFAICSKDARKGMGMWSAYSLPS